MPELSDSKLSVSKQITADEIETLMKHENLTVSKAAERLDISPATARSILGMKTRQHRVRWDEENIEKLKSMLDKGMSKKDIAQEFGTSEAAIVYQASIHRFSYSKNHKKKEVRKPVNDIPVSETADSSENNGSALIANAWLSPSKIQIFDGSNGRKYVINFENGLVSAVLGKRFDRASLLTIAREFMAIEQLFVEKERAK